MFCILENIIKLFRERPLLISKFDISKLQKQLRSVIQIHLEQSATFGPLSLNVRDNKPQHKWLKVNRNATNRHKHTNEASKQNFADNLFKKSCEYTQDMISSGKICFNVFNIPTCDEFLCKLNETNKIVNRTTCTNFSI